MHALLYVLFVHVHCSVCMLYIYLAVRTARTCTRLYVCHVHVLGSLCHVHVLGCMFSSYMYTALSVTRAFTRLNVLFCSYVYDLYMYSVVCAANTCTWFYVGIVRVMCCTYTSYICMALRQDCTCTRMYVQLVHAHFGLFKITQ